MKIIHKLSDLAINGALPAFNEKVHVGRPNVGDKSKFLAMASDILENKWLTNDGPYLRALESELSSFLGVRNCIAVTNGTIGLQIAIKAMGLTGEVIMPSYTFIATAQALSWQGITPIFADIRAEDHNINPDAIEKLISSKTTGILGVHLWGEPCNINQINEIAKRNNLKILFDAAHAFGASFDGRMIGNFGNAEVFSFHATKFFNTFEGGAIATNDDELANRIRLMRNFGFSGFDNVVEEGINGKLCEMNAAMGLINFEALNKFVERNIDNHNLYKKIFENIDHLSLMGYQGIEKRNFQYVVLEVGEKFPCSRDEIIRVLHAENILARKYFWPGCHNMKTYSKKYEPCQQELENTNSVANRVIVLPTGSGISKDQIQTIGEIFILLSR
jgi:dTDP-4-amino-4,6-dideoxygalactose transaminase